MLPFCVQNIRYVSIIASATAHILPCVVDSVVMDTALARLQGDTPLATKGAAEEMSP